MPIRVVLSDKAEIVRQAIRGLFSGFPEIELVGEADDLAQTVQLVKQLKPHVIVIDLQILKNRLGEVAPEFTPGAAKLLAISLSNDDDAKRSAERFGALKLLDKMNLYDELVPAIIEIAHPKNMSAAAAGK